MKCSSVQSYLVKYLLVLCLVLSFIDNVVPQLNHGVGIGLPLPVLKEGQGQSAGRINPDPNFRNTHRPTANTPFTVVLDDDESIISPNLGIGLPRSAVNSNTNRDAARGPGSLQHIRDASQDTVVRSLLSHPEVLKKIQKKTSSDSAVKVDSIISAHRQVVSGEITYLDIKVVETKCSIGTHNLAACEVDVSEDPYICEVAVWRRPWLNSTKVIDEKTRCAEVESDNDFKNWNRGSSPLRRQTNPIALRGLPPYLDANQVALEAFDYINRGSESKFKGQMINYHFGDVKHDSGLNITTVEVKVEYGFTLCLKFPNRKVDDRICPIDNARDNYICAVTVMSDPNLTTNLKVLPDPSDDDIDCDKRHSADEELVIPVKSVCMGCPQTASFNDPAVLRIADFAIIEYDRTSDDSELHTMIKLHKAQTQVTNGIKYYLTFELAETDCRKPLSAVNMNRTLCNRKRDEETEICEVVVVEQPWQKAMEMISARCYDKDDYPSSHHDEFIVPVLGQAPHSPSLSASPSAHAPAPSAPAPSAPAPSAPSPSLTQSLNIILGEFNRREVDDDDDGFYMIVNVISATTSSEARGQVDRIVVKLGETLCTRRTRSTDCPFKFGESPEICSASVLKGNPGRLLSLRCDDDDDHYRLTSNPMITPYQPAPRPFFHPSPSTLGAPGAPVQQQVNSSTTLEIARFVVDQYNLQSDDDELYKLSKVISAFSQVSGTAIFTLELELLETECKKYQPVVDVSRCPVEPREDAEVCQAEVAVSFASGNAKQSKRLTRIFCDDREDFYVKKMRQANGARGQAQGTWKTEDSSTDKVKHMGKLIADEFDFRSDEDNIFVLFKVIESKTQTSGLSHQLKVELAETVCPKYKERIDKTRCAVDIGEEHKICDAIVSERPWKNDHQVANLRCFERDDSVEDDESREILYPRVHPSAHARPKFLQSRFRVRVHSQESDESNEKYYRVGASPHSIRRFDSDEGHVVRVENLAGRRHHLTRRFDTDDDDDDDRDSDRRHDNDSRSSEHSQSAQLRFRRSPPTGAPVEETAGGSSIMAGAPATVKVDDPKVKEIADFALDEMDQAGADPRRRRVEEVLEATRKVVAGLLWTIKTRVTYTDCLKTAETALSECSASSDPSYICTVQVWDKPWLKSRTLKESECVPQTS